jgi:hypothetical protein
LHWVVPGVHVPAHAPALQTLAHAAPLTQAPDGSHVWGVSPAHCLVPGAQVPVQAPATQAWLPQGTAAPHCPLVPQVCRPSPEHWSAPGSHTPVQAPVTQA